MQLSDFHNTSSDWRAQIKKNERKTKSIIIIFILIYLLVGLIIDVLILQSAHPYAPIQQYLSALITFQIVPIATITMLIVAGISLFITFTLHDKIMLLGTDSFEINSDTARTLEEKQLFNVVDELRIAAGLSFMPKVYLIEADYMNAFASGISEKSSMVAITRGLLQKLTRTEIQAVMAHELSHIRHHDMKVTLVTAILSNLLLIVVDFLFYNMIYGRERREDNRLFIVIILLRYLLPLMTILLTLFLSRTREYMADAGAVELMRDNQPLANALIKINQDHEQNAQEYAAEYGKTPHEEVRNAAYLYDPSMIDPVKSLTNLFSTHPNLIDRLRALGFKQH